MIGQPVIGRPVLDPGLRMGGAGRIRPAWTGNWAVVRYVFIGLCIFYGPAR